MNYMSEKLSSYSFDMESRLRKTSQYLMPPQLNKPLVKDDGYDIYPVCALGEHKIFNGYGSLTDWIISQRNVVIDGYVGVFWEKIQQEINTCLQQKGLTANWIRKSSCSSKRTKKPTRSTAGRRVPNVRRRLVGGRACWRKRASAPRADARRGSARGGQAVADGSRSGRR